MIISLVRTLILYLLIIAILRLLGKRQIGELQTSELVVALVIANLASIPIEDVNIPLTAGIVPIITIAFLEMLISVLGLKWKGFRRLVTGEPVIVIADGKVNQHALRKLRLSTEDLMSSLRQSEANIFELSEVSYAIVETNGQLTVLPKKSNTPPDAQTLGVKVEDKGVGALVISDGTISDAQLKIAGKNRGWLDNILKKEKKKPDEVFLMTANYAGDYMIVKKEEKNK